jgi:4-cresol dehydrogenase (hydroxylating)
MALEQWRAHLGGENVILDSVALRAAETATFETRVTVPAIVRPGNREDVQQILRIANQWRIPVYPVSGGCNWGYGSRVPSASGCVLMDLGRMNRILDFSEDLAYITVEPGVTQQQVYAFLQARSSGLWMDATGASPQASLVGNAVERGFGHTPYGDHFSHVCGMEVVLPNGQTLETGFSRFEGARTGPLHRWGVGAYLDGLFTQSNLGVVTRMSIWLMPAPEYFQAYFFSCDSEAGLAPIIEALRPLRPERDTAQYRAHRQRLQGTVGNATVSLGGSGGPHSLAGRCHAATAEAAAFRRMERFRRPLRYAGAGVGSPAAVARRPRRQSR